MDQEIVDMAENSATCSGRNTEIIRDIEGLGIKYVPVVEREVIDLVTTLLSTTDIMNKILNQLSEDISDTKHMLATTYTKQMLATNENKKMKTASAEVEMQIIASDSEKRGRKRKMERQENPLQLGTYPRKIIPPASDIAMESIKSLKVSNGAPFENMAENSATYSGRNTEVIGEIEYLGTESVPVVRRKVMDLVATILSTTGIMNDILDQLNESVSDTKQMLATNENKKMKTASAEIEMQTIASDSEKRGRKRKLEQQQNPPQLGAYPRKIIPPASVMVMESIKSLKMSNGASFEDIQKHMEETYPINVKPILKYHVKDFLQRYVDYGVLEKTVVGTDTRFKIKEE